jgi:hypothetical protein
MIRPRSGLKILERTLIDLLGNRLERTGALPVGLSIGPFELPLSRDEVLRIFLHYKNRFLI